MNKKAIVPAVLAVIMLSMSASVAKAYYEYGPATAFVCNIEKPQKAWLYRVKSLGQGKYQLYWDKADKASSWTVGYGTQSGKYIYGISNFGDGNSRDIVISTFSNKKFYFVVKANNGCMPGDWSNEWKVGTGSTISTLVTTGTARTVVPTPAVNKTVPVVTNAPAKTTQPVVTKAPVVNNVVNPQTLPKTGGFWGWLKGLFQ